MDREFADDSTLIDHDCLIRLGLASHLKKWGDICKSILSKEEPL